MNTNSIPSYVCGYERFLEPQFRICKSSAECGVDLRDNPSKAFSTVSVTSQASLNISITIILSVDRDDVHIYSFLL